jgi:hypothetical protein
MQALIATIGSWKCLERQGITGHSGNVIIPEPFDEFWCRINADVSVGVIERRLIFRR